jgi:hypothetical protein
VINPSFANQGYDPTQGGYYAEGWTVDNTQASYPTTLADGPSGTSGSAWILNSTQARSSWVSQQLSTQPGIVYYYNWWMSDLYENAEVNCTFNNADNSAILYSSDIQDYPN